METDRSEAGTGSPFSSESDRNPVSIVLAEPPSKTACVGMGDHRGAPFSITLNKRRPLLTSSPSSIEIETPWGIGLPIESSRIESNRTVISEVAEFHPLNSGSELVIDSMERGVSASLTKPTREIDSVEPTFTVGVPTNPASLLPSTRGSALLNSKASLVKSHSLCWPAASSHITLVSYLPDSAFGGVWIVWT